MTVKPTAKNRLLVEGKDDKWTIIHLLERHDIDWNAPSDKMPFVHECGGIPDLMGSISVSAKTYYRLGIVIDANSRPLVRWQQIKDRLKQINVTLPDNPVKGGIITQGIDLKRKIGVWLMPDNSTDGTLEHFLRTLIPQYDPCWLYTEEVVKHVKTLGAKYQISDEIKVRIHSWLSWQENPGCPFGTAIKAHFFMHDSHEALEFTKWFTRLFL